MDTQGSAENSFLDQDVIARAATVRSERNRFLRASCAKLVGSLLAALRAGRMRRKLGALSDRQLSDAGIDLTLAGRGKSAAAQPNPGVEGSR